MKGYWPPVIYILVFDVGNKNNYVNDGLIT